jgi:cobalt-zinc-cadmium efflux system protein
MANRPHSTTRALGWTLALVLFYMAAEVVGGWWTGSLALLADAGHMLSDAASLGLALFAVWLGRRPADDRRTYGYRRVEILAALANGATLIVVAVLILREAIERFQAPREVLGGPMMAIAAGGLVINLIGLRLLGGHGHGHSHDHGHDHPDGEPHGHPGSGASEGSLNLRGAWLHVAADALGSVQAIVAGLLIWAFGWRWADPVASALIAVLVAWSSWTLLREAVGVLMEGAPRHVDLDEVRRTIRATGGVDGVHDLHVWTITSGMVSLSAHVVVTAEGAPSRTLEQVRSRLLQRFGIHHATIQLEPHGYVCRQTPCEQDR